MRIAFPLYVEPLPEVSDGMSQKSYTDDVLLEDIFWVILVFLVAMMIENDLNLNLLLHRLAGGNGDLGIIIQRFVFVFKAECIFTVLAIVWDLIAAASKTVISLRNAWPLLFAWSCAVLGVTV